MERKLWRDDHIEKLHNDPVFAGIVDMIAHALDAGKIDIEQARAVGLIAVNKHVSRLGLRPMLLVTMPPGVDGVPDSISVDGMVYRHDRTTKL